MSYTDVNDWGSGRITAAIIFFAIIAVPTSALAALLGVVTWGEFSGWGLVNRLICITSPILALACLIVAREANRRGDYYKAILSLSALAVPLILMLGLVTWAAVQS